MNLALWLLVVFLCIPIVWTVFALAGRCLVWGWRFATAYREEGVTE